MKINILGTDDGPTSSGVLLDTQSVEAGLDSSGNTVNGNGTDAEGGALFANTYDPEGTELQLTIENPGNQQGAYGILTVDSNGSYTYELDQSNEAIDALANGELIIDSFQTTVRDQFGFTGTQAIDIQITGSNDAPVITSSINTGEITEIVEGDQYETNSTLTATGTFDISEVDITDVLTAVLHS